MTTERGEVWPPSPLAEERAIEQEFAAPYDPAEFKGEPQRPRPAPTEVSDRLRELREQHGVEDADGLCLVCETPWPCAGWWAATRIESLEADRAAWHAASMDRDRQITLRDARVAELQEENERLREGLREVQALTWHHRSEARISRAYEAATEALQQPPEQP